KQWEKLIALNNQDGGTDEINFSPVKARYVKIIGIKRANLEWGISMWEFEMYGPKNLNPGEKERVIGENIQEKQEELEKAIAELKRNPGKLNPGEFHKGIVYTSWSYGELGSLPSDLTLVYLQKLGVRHIAIVVPTYQESVDSKDIVIHDFEGGDTPSDESIEHAIKTAHLLGIKLMLKPHVDCLDGTMRMDIMASADWFKSYKNMILHYAKLAQKNDVDIFCAGTELENTTSERWEKEWRDIISAIKEVYSGYITYSANWSEYKYVPFWDMTDIIGIDAYFPLTDKNDPTEEELVAAWNRVADGIEIWLKDSNLNKEIIFTELGYVSSDGTNKQPWATLTNPEDQKEQADALNAAFTVLTARSWFKGLYLWQYFPQERWSPLGFSIRGKLAEGVLRKWYNR
ncbi:MAG: glycoside hydrolase TIM-barrel-like domain-containing protein, partial [Candidatus Omnitrophica bacterium]|nr:glycoside hydrolase TIM-barrel-like domain-containing protein [Candidatus Omnitrophota bacterium]